MSALENNIRNHFKMTPTDDQEKAIKTFPRFMNVSSFEVPLFILKGYAGTGKTSLVAAWIKALKDYGQKSVLLAPTGRAAKVLSSHAGQEAYTIHKKIYVHKRTKEGVQVERALNAHKNTVFFVDEASMISIDGSMEDGLVKSGNLLEDLIEYVYQGKNCRMVLIGDNFQLPPVGWDESPAINEDYLKVNYSVKVGSVYLKQVVRQAEESNILYNATILRSFPENIPQLIPGNDVDQVNGNELADKIEEMFDNYGSDQVAIITRSNKAANIYNNQIRSRILWYEDRLVQNDRLMVVKNNYYWLDKKDKMAFIANGEMGTVVRILKIYQRYEMNFASIIMKFKDDPEEKEHEVIILMDTLEEEGPALSKAKAKQLYHNIEADFSSVRSPKTRYEKVTSTPEYNALQVKFAYAVTCHKSQGGQWPVVFIDHGWVQPEQIDLGFNRWLYTALTRASEKVVLVNFMPQLIGEEE